MAITLFEKLLTRSIDAGSERYRRATLTSLVNVFSQLVNLATGLISIPLALGYVGIERFGIWMTLSMALAFITFSDFGIGIGMQDRMTRYIGSNCNDLAQQTFISSFSFVCVLFLMLTLVGAVILPQIDLASALSLESVEAIQDITPTARVVILVLGLGLPAGIVQRAFNAFQEGFWVGLIQAVARVSSLVLLLLVVELKLGLPALVFAVGGLPSAIILLVGLPLLFFRHRWLVPARWSRRMVLDWSRLGEVARVGVFGFGASIAIYFVNNSIPVLISLKHGAADVADFAVMLKLLAIPTLLLFYLLFPLWPAITEANVRREHAWISNLYDKCARVTFVVALVSSLLFLSFGQSTIRVWTQNETVIPSFGLLLAGTCFMVLGLWSTLTSVMLNGLSQYRSQATLGLGIAVSFAILASFVPDRLSKEWIVWVVNLGYLVRCVIMQREIVAYVRGA